MIFIPGTLRAASEICGLLHIFFKIIKIHRFSKKTDYVDIEFIPLTACCHLSNCYHRPTHDIDKLLG